MLRKGLVVIVILLFIGVAFTPSINANVNKDELVELEVELCGLNKKNIVKLTQEQADEVDFIFDEIRIKLDGIESREGAEEIFKDVIVELDKYSLLGELSIKQAQNLVTDKYKDKTGFELLKKLHSKNQGLRYDNDNQLCLIAGQTSNTLINSIFEKIFFLRVEEYPEGTINIWFALYLIAYFIGLNSPYVIGADVCFLPNAEGWVFSIGSSDIKEWNGLLKGLIPKGDYPQDRAIVGLNGFKVRIDSDDENFFYLGTALNVDIEEI